MKLPIPKVGSVIRYSYLWAAEADKGIVEGRKDRPATVIALAVRDDDDGTTEVLVLAVTHTPARRPTDAVELPPATQRALGLDQEPAWVVTGEANAFVWPGPDIRPVPRRKPMSAVYGELPRALLRDIAQSYLANRRRLLRQVRR